jgi:hypothetical protein
MAMKSYFLGQDNWIDGIKGTKAGGRRQEVRSKEAGK